MDQLINQVTDRVLEFWNCSVATNVERHEYLYNVCREVAENPAMFSLLVKKELNKRDPKLFSSIYPTRKYR